MKSLFIRIRDRANLLKQETHALYLAYRHPDTPWYAKVFSALVVAYAFSPIDLIPDFIPVLGYLDDLLLVPLGIYLSLKLIPEEIYKEARAQAADAHHTSPPAAWWVAGLILLAWLGLAVLAGFWAVEIIQNLQGR